MRLLLPALWDLFLFWIFKYIWFPWGENSMYAAQFGRDH